MQEAMYYTTLDTGKIQCQLCPQSCILAEGKAGICGTRQNKDNRLFAINYGRISGLSMDPIEKKPLYHFFPGNPILSAGTLGCNFHCRFCQNYHLSQYYHQQIKLDVTTLSPQELVNEALAQHSFGIAYTYSEPLVWYEYVLHTAKLSREQGLKNVLITNGFINSRPLNELLPWIDAANVDLKAFTDEHYRALGGNLETIKNNIKTIYESGTHLELTTLIVTRFNDIQEELESLFQWIANIDRDIPLHLSRYHPSFRSTAPATNPDFMMEMTGLARQYLRYVYTGNMPGNQDSRCPHCDALLVARDLYHICIDQLDTGSSPAKCRQCGNTVHFITS